MIGSNLRLVVTIAQDYLNLGLPLSDLISEGRIKQSIKLALSNQVKTIRLPVHLVEKISKIWRIAVEMAHDLGRAPNDDELAEEIGMSPDRVAELRSGPVRSTSLDALIDDDGSTEFGEIIEDQEARTSYEWLRDRDLQGRVQTALQFLDHREKEIVLQRFGLNGSQPKTLGQLGETIGLPRERIGQLQGRALLKLRRALTKEDRSTRVDRTIAAKMPSPGRGNGDKPIGVRDKSFACAVAELGGRTVSFGMFAKRKF
jgi:RNA polymerase primary sigma factor